MTDTTTSTMTGQAFGAAREAEQLGIVGILVLVLIASWVLFGLLWRAHTQQALTFAEVIAQWQSVATNAANRARKAEQKVASLDDRLDKIADDAPRSRRGGGG